MRTYKTLIYGKHEQQTLCCRTTGFLWWLFIISGSPAHFCPLPEGKLVQIIENADNEGNMGEYVGKFARITKEYVHGNTFEITTLERVYEPIYEDVIDVTLDDIRFTVPPDPNPWHHTPEISEEYYRIINEQSFANLVSSTEAEGIADSLEWVIDEDNIIYVFFPNKDKDLIGFTIEARCGGNICLVKIDGYGEHYIPIDKVIQWVNSKYQSINTEAKQSTN